ncbi:hypothetical protein GTW25_18850 [Aliihoeflea aestuarii]|jgi:hypothetical protein|uniref:hypothetical protein n=1 Tax=Aliihoeflea aestuarii TaxID=453840 RepID=UPI0020945033|nr:hypothetical protein [Aliihoeflea aestuarii]MCO6393084.1 hypothetical protein [Aliihoeflea aestuarii]
MTTRSQTRTVVFDAAFTLPGIGEELPAGAYRVESDDEELGGVTWTARRNLATYIHLPSIAQASRPQQIVQIDADDLEVEAALTKDKQP